jgi:NTP pyrophosphatase (non-canonical NTP hydrolase)|tara:strand:- start:4812 stop:5000 length:189 start_codon:yes stop_codon:yes gene_type:complete
LLDAINKDDKHEIKDASGDIVVTLILQCKMQNISLVECLQQAYDVISKRTGQMKDGIFIKDN